MSAAVIAFPASTALTPGQRAILRREAANLRAVAKRHLEWADLLEACCFKGKLEADDWWVIEGTLGAIKMQKFETA
jgi:hypothetical protein